MTFMEYFRRSQSWRVEVAIGRPVTFLVQEMGRYAATMALLLVIVDPTPFAFTTPSAWGRVRFLGLWSLAMAAWSLWRTRARTPDTHRSSASAI